MAVRYVYKEMICSNTNNMCLLRMVVMAVVIGYAVCSGGMR